MSPSTDARTQNTNDIPIAHRSRGFPGSSKRAIRLWFFVLTGVMVFGVSTNFLTKSNLRTRSQIYRDLPSPDGRLLGHYPYPEASKAELVTAYPGIMVHKDTFEALRLMTSAASLRGIKLVLLSGYRSHDLQEEIFFEVKSNRNQSAIERARVSAPPGYSEHSTGYAIDLGDGTRRETDFEVDFQTTPAFLWLKNNAAKYHFILSFPEGNQQGVSYEPWHWRFEGTAQALKAFEDARRANSLLNSP